MTTLQSDDCQSNDPNNLFPTAIESLRFPLDSSMRIIFTGYFNGFNVEVRSCEEMAMLHHMGCFGKGSLSRSKPKVSQNDNSPCLMRKRQFLKRNYWQKKFSKSKDSQESDSFFKEIDELAAKIRKDSERNKKKDVIDLVSSDEDMGSDACEEFVTPSNLNMLDTCDKQDLVVIAPDSDSEGDNYFANFKPKCCLNKIKIPEKLMLTLCEAFFLSFGLGCLQIMNSEEKLLSTDQCWDLFLKTDKKFIPKYVVYHYFRSKGYIVKPGIKFGGDYLLYKEVPGTTHADYIVVIKNEHETTDFVSLLGHIRMANTTVKEVLIAEITKSDIDLANVPENLNAYSVREILLSRKMPVTINDDD